MATKLQVEYIDRLKLGNLNFNEKFVSLLPSKRWLLDNGLKARGLSFYQILGPNAYSYAQTYIPSIDKEVKSTVHHQSMVQVDWFNGSVKNVHVDPAVLNNYTHQLSNAIRIYKKQFSLMHTGSRQMFGNISESSIIIIVDLSQEASSHICYLFPSFKLLFEEQLLQKKYFKIICCNETLDCYESTFPVKESISECWNWLLSLSCSGIRKFLPALKVALRQKTSDFTGLYLVSLGRIYDNMDVLVSYIEEAMVGSQGVTLNCIFLQPPDLHPLDPPNSNFYPKYDLSHVSKDLRRISEIANGKFHWSFESDVVDDEDMRLLASEINKAGSYMKKTEMLLEKYQLKCEQKKKINSC